MDLTWMTRLEGAVRPWHEGAEDILCALAFEHGRLLGENERLGAFLEEFSEKWANETLDAVPR